MPIGKPFGRRPQQKSSKLYEDRIANAGKLPVEKPSLSPIASLMAFAVCLVAAGVFCITSGQVVVGIGVILFGMVPAVAMVAMAKQLVDKVVDGSAALVGPQASQESFGEDAERAFRLRMLEQHVFDREVARHEAEDEQAAAERERDERKNMRHGARPCERVGRRCAASAAKRLRSEQAYRANGNASEGDDQAE